MAKILMSLICSDVFLLQSVSAEAFAYLHKNGATLTFGGLTEKDFSPNHLIKHFVNTENALQVRTQNIHVFNI